MPTRRAVLLALPLLLAGPAVAADLARFRWQNRLLLVSAPEAADPDLAAQRAIVATHADALRDRDMVTVEVVGDFVRIDGAVTPMDAATLRAHYRLDVGAFTALLIGKDGGTKLRQSKPLTADQLFPTIDAMPMRRQEMRERGQEAWR